MTVQSLKNNQMSAPADRPSGHRPCRSTKFVALLVLAMLVFAACGDDAESETSDTTAEVTDAAEEADEADEADEAADGATRESGMTVTVQDADGVTVHTLTAPEAVFANSTHLIETENTLVAFDAQFLLPNAMDVRAYAEELGKPIDRLYITHEHPDHFLGSEAFADLPIFSLQEVSDLIAANGDAEVEEKQGDFGPEAIAGSFVVPKAVEPGTVEIDGVTFEFEQVMNAEAENQLVTRLPDHGVVITGDIVYSDIHLVLAGQPDTWTAALEALAATGDEYPIVLPGHGGPGDPSLYDENIEWLATAGQLLAASETGEEFKQGMIDAFPELGAPATIDLVLPFLFPEG